MVGIGLAMGVAGGLMKKGAKIPAYKKVDQAQEQGAAISSNLASFGKSKELAAKTSAADQEILMANLEKAMPGYSNLIGGASGAIGNMIAGNLPMADQGLLMRRAAEGGMAGGMSGSQAGRNLVARDLGLSQMNMTQAGLGALNPFLSTVRNTAVANPMSVRSSYVDPTQWTRNAIQENQFAYGAAIGKAKNDAANSFQNKLAGGLSSVGGMMAGGMFGGGGGGGGLGGIMGRMFGGSGSAATTPNLVASNWQAQQRRTIANSGGYGGTS